MGWPPLDRRFFRQVRMTDTCWVWAGFRNAGGYGRLRAHGREQLAHRVAYQEIVGPIPEGLALDHLCKNRACVRPEHLEPVTTAENNRRSPKPKGFEKTHCPRGHEYTPENVYQYIDKNGITHRTCRTCARPKARERMRKVHARRQLARI